MNNGAMFDILIPVSGRSVLGLAIERGYMDLVKRIIATTNNENPSSLFHSKIFNIESASILFGQTDIW